MVRGYNLPLFFPPDILDKQFNCNFYQIIVISFQKFLLTILFFFHLPQETLFMCQVGL